MSEPCKHEREFAGTQADTLTSFINTSGALVKMTAERNALRVEVARLQAFLPPMDESSVDLRPAALEPRCTCDGITSQHGVDQNDGPDKVWRCDECDRIWETS